ncbi:hypothetical protein K457DRAFT_131821 [Linnemannia elongata AG-77]|uniref:Uncharacterized protein n=1 Tax=Linnemannia elongata AG-77 TaxID=1314771 RepID=A0A197KHK2_9FUNG|nr:hypothetical protein K457DRAFT_131821 [Linnemannia elongata AG-77]
MTVLLRSVASLLTKPLLKNSLIHLNASSFVSCNSFAKLKHAFTQPSCTILENVP